MTTNRQENNAWIKTSHVERKTLNTGLAFPAFVLLNLLLMMKVECLKPVLSEEKLSKS